MPNTLIKPSFSSEYLCSILSYDPGTGILRWKYRADCKANWNARWVGKTAGVITAGKIAVAIFQVKYQAHNLIWYMQTDEWPENEVDHKDRNGLNNKWDNLRPSTRNQNMMNTRLRSDNTSGHKGVSWNKEHNAWRVRIQVAGREKLIGYIKDYAEAVAAREKAAKAAYGEFYSD